MSAQRLEGKQECRYAPRWTVGFGLTLDVSTTMKKAWRSLPSKPSKLKHRQGVAIVESRGAISAEHMDRRGVNALNDLFIRSWSTPQAGWQLERLVSTTTGKRISEPGFALKFA